MAKFLSFWILVGSIFVMGCGDDEAPLPVSDFLNTQADGASGESGGEAVEPVGDVTDGPGSGTKDTGSSEEGDAEDAQLGNDAEGGEGSEGPGDEDTNPEGDASEEADADDEDAAEGEGGEGSEGDGGSVWLPSTCDDSSTCPGLQLCTDGECGEPPICLTDQDCINGRVCSHGICADVPFGCQVDAECFGGYCNTFNGKCSNEFPCIDQSGCATGICSGTACVECITDTDCPIPSVQSCVSQECVEPAACSSTSECLNGNECSLGECSAPVPEPDSYEPNDSGGEAPVLSAVSEVELTMESGGVDWYRIAVLPGVSPLVRIEFDDTYGDLDMRLYEVSTGVLVSRDDRKLPFAVVGARGQDTETMTLFLEITHVSGVVPGYTLTMFESSKGFCMNDGFDNAGGENDKAVSPVLEGPVANLDGLMICPGDVDWFRVSSDGDLNMTGEIIYPYMPGAELQVSLQKESEEVSQVFVGKNGNLDWTAEGLGAGIWYMRVEGTTPEAQTAFELNVNIGEGQSCADDSLEPNNAIDGATELIGGEVLNLSMCEGDEDWFTIVLPPGKGASFRFEYGAAVQDITGTVYSESGEVLAVAEEPTPLGNEETRTVSVEPLPGGGLIALQVRHDDTAAGIPSSPYFMEVEVAEEPCEEEDGEDNGTQDSATVIPIFGIPVDGGFCGSDYADWYSINLGPGDVIALEVAYEELFGNLLMHLFDPSGTSLVAVGSSVGWGGGRVTSFTVPTWWKAGSYKLLLTGDYTGNYQVLPQKYPGALCLEQVGEQEPNDSKLTATMGELGVPLMSGVCGGDPDVYAWMVEPDAPLSIVVNVSNPGGWANLLIENRWGEVLVEENILLAEKTYEFTPEEVGSDMVFVTLKSGLPTSIDLLVE